MKCNRQDNRIAECGSIFEGKALLMIGNRSGKRGFFSASDRCSVMLLLNNTARLVESAQKDCVTCKRVRHGCRTILGCNSSGEDLRIGDIARAFIYTPSSMSKDSSLH